MQREHTPCLGSGSQRLLQHVQSKNPAAAAACKRTPERICVCGWVHVRSGERTLLQVSQTWWHSNSSMGRVRNVISLAQYTAGWVRMVMQPLVCT